MQRLAPDNLEVFKITFKHAAIGLSITDLQGRFVASNEAFSRITGYSSDELRLTDCLSITHPDYHRSNEELTRRLLGGEIQTYVLEKEYIRKTGDLVWVQDSVSLVRGMNGRPVNLVALCDNITERTLAQKALQESEERFRIQFKATPVPTFSWRHVEGDFILVDYNDAAERITANGIVNLLGSKASQLYAKTPEVFEVMKDCVDLKGTIRRTGDFRFLSTGELKHLDASFVFVPPDLVMIHTEDITERHLAKQAIIEAERKYRDMFENANEGVFQSTPEGRFLTVNPALARILGFDSPEELIRERTNINSQHYPDASRREEFKRLLEEHGFVRGFEYEAYRKDGSRLWMSDSVRTVSNEDGTTLYYEGIAEDITERKRSENALRKQKEILQTIVDHIPVMIGLIDKKGRLQLVNRQWEHTLGWSHWEIIKGNLDIIALSFPNPTDRQAALDFISDASGEWVDFRNRIKDGRVIDTSWAVVSLSDGTIIGIGKDVTQEKRVPRLNAAAANLAHGLSGARSPLEAARKIAQIADELFGWHSCSVQLYDSKKDLVQRILSVDTVAGEREEVTQVAISPPTAKGRRVIENGAELLVRQAPCEFETTSVPFGDTSRPSASIMTVPVRYGTNVVGLLSVQSYETHAYDEVSIKELQSLADLCGEALNRIRAEQSLYESEERFRQIAENIDAVIWMVDLGVKNVLYINPAYERLWGRSVESMYEEVRSLIDSVHPADRDKVDLLQERQMRGQYHKLEYRILRPDGSVRWIQRRSFPIRDAEGKAYRVAGVAEDITERKRAETELINFSRRLLDAQESERKQIARELHDDIGQVLTAVRINLQSLEQSNGANGMTTQVRESIRVIDEAVKRVRDLSFELRPSLLDDLGLAAATRWYVDRYAKRVGVKAEVRIDFEKPEARLPREVETACFRILQEALTNVARHAQAAHVSVHLASVGSSLFLTVKDDGVGMEAAALQEKGNHLSTLGLRGMEERALAVAGQLEIISFLSQGTEVRASFPVVNLNS